MKSYEVIVAGVSRIVQAEKKEYAKETGQLFLLVGDEVVCMVPKEGFLAIIDSQDTPVYKEACKIADSLQEMLDDDFFHEGGIKQCINDLRNIHEIN